MPRRFSPDAHRHLVIVVRIDRKARNNRTGRRNVRALTRHGRSVVFIIYVTRTVGRRLFISRVWDEKRVHASNTPETRFSNRPDDVNRSECRSPHNRRTDTVTPKLTDARYIILNAIRLYRDRGAANGPRLENPRRRYIYIYYTNAVV